MVSSRINMLAVGTVLLILFLLIWQENVGVFE